MYLIPSQFVYAFIYMEIVGEFAGIMLMLQTHIMGSLLIQMHHQVVWALSWTQFPQGSLFQPLRCPSARGSSSIHSASSTSYLLHNEHNHFSAVSFTSHWNPDRIGWWVADCKKNLWKYPKHLFIPLLEFAQICFCSWPCPGQLLCQNSCLHQPKCTAGNKLIMVKNLI